MTSDFHSPSAQSRRLLARPVQCLRSDWRVLEINLDQTESQAEPKDLPEVSGPVKET